MTGRYASKISSKGQVTIPIAIRKRLGLRAGDRIEFVMERTRTVLRPLRASARPFSEFQGILGNQFPGGREEGFRPCW
ncbi:MAG: AbrB/MazE/SpoVT family DNA-binding domain-containing protein [Terriglobales bacterium]